MGNKNGAEAGGDESSDEEYVVVRITLEDLRQMQKNITNDDLEAFEKHLPEVKTVDTDAYLEPSDALVADEEENVHILKGLFECDLSKGDAFDQLIETGYVTTMQDFAVEQEAQRILGWLNAGIESEKIAQLSAELPDFVNLTKGTGMVPADMFMDVVNTIDVCRVENVSENLLKGGIQFWYKAIVGHKAKIREKGFIRSMVNLSDFDNEEEENGVPIIDVDDAKQMKKYTFVLSKGLQLAPFDDINMCGIEVVTDLDYQQFVQSYANENIHIMKPGEDGWNPKNDRTLRAVTRLAGNKIKFTVQNQSSIFPVEKINEDPNLSDGIKWDIAFLTERTKQNIAHQDSTAKLKLLFTAKQLEDGVLIMLRTCTVNSLLPSWMVNMGKKPAIQTALKLAKGARGYFKEKYDEHEQGKPAEIPGYTWPDKKEASPDATEESLR